MTMTPTILDALATLERDCEVRVLYAAESGSRAWGFASPDSDYDVRFVYARELRAYLRVHDGTDVIERMLPGDLDVSGWDLRKALQLFARCNSTLYEWLLSPIVYREDAAFAEPLRAAMAQFFQPAAALHHYLGIARNTWTEHLSGDNVRLKKMFYFLRPVLACRWIEHAGSQPPTEFGRLVDAPWVTDDERETIALLQQRKQLASERDRDVLSDELKQWMQDQLSHFTQIGPGLARRLDRPTDTLDTLMADLLLR